MIRRIALVGIAATLALTACGGENVTTPATDNAASSSAPSPIDTPAAPASPDAATTAAYLAALTEIAPDIVGKKDSRTLVNRGRSQCDSIRQWPNDEARLVDLANKRFTAPGHPDGFGEAKARKILDVVKEYICP